MEGLARQPIGSARASAQVTLISTPRVCKPRAKRERLPPPLARTRGKDGGVWEVPTPLGVKINMGLVGVPGLPHRPAA